MNQLLGSLAYDAEHGSLSLQSARYMMIRPTLFVELHKSVESHLGQEAAAILSETAATEGAELSSRFRDVFSYTDEQVMNAVAYMLSESGWGVVSVEMTNFEGRELVFKVLDSPFAGGLRPIDTACVSHIAGNVSRRSDDPFRIRVVGYGKSSVRRKGIRVVASS